jgi:hypothetical protein
MWYTVTFVKSWDIAEGTKQTQMEAATTKTARKTALPSGVLRYKIVI